MLNFNALDSAHSMYKKTLISEADLCGKEIKLISEKFTKMGVPDTHFSWIEKGSITVNDVEEDIDFSAGIFWDSIKSKIFYWFDDPYDPKVLSGETAVIRANLRSKLSRLVEQATIYLESKTNELTKKEDLDDEDIFEDSDTYEPDSWQDRMLVNGEQE